jgi:S-formylglutathione hydrolase FrmB
MEGRDEFINCFGDITAVKGSDNDLFALAEQFAGLDEPKPKLYQCCGTEDFIYRDNVKFRDHARELGIDLTYEEAPGDHNWGFWDEWIQRVLEWLPLQNQ